MRHLSLYLSGLFLLGSSAIVAASSEIDDDSLQELVGEAMEMVNRAGRYQKDHIRTKRKTSKVSSDSLKIQARNELFQKTVELLVSKKALDETEAIRVAVRGIKHHLHAGLGASPGGQQFSFILPELMEVSCIEPELMECADYPYRTLSGLCNNLEHHTWGSSSIAMRRFVEPAYADGNSDPRGQRKSAEGHCERGHGEEGDCFGRPDTFLPNPRWVSTQFHPDPGTADLEHTHMLTQMGQFLDHDISFTPETDVDCCNSMFKDPKACFAIGIPCGEEHFTPCFLEHAADEAQNNIGSGGYTGGADTTICQHGLEFHRSLPFCNTNGEVEHLEQINGITAFVDASNVYGSTKKISDNLRLFHGGLLKFKNTGGRPLLPVLTPKGGNPETLAGDVRSSENPGLAAMHTVFLREHNRLATQMVDDFAYDPVADDQLIFDTVRRIVGAEMQNVVYNQYLSSVLGDNLMNEGSPNGKLISEDDSVYDPEVDPSIRNSFATAAFRFGHSMVGDLIKMVTLTSISTSDSSFGKNFFDLDLYLAGSGVVMEEILFGLLHQLARDTDKFVIDDLTNELFANVALPGSDLVARNIQRGRDHGIPGYNHFREFCGLEPACSWGDKPEEITEKNWEMLKELYGTPGDIDLFVAGLAEHSLNDGILGPTFSCIVSRQFRKLKDGDRYFFTHQDDPSLLTHPFTDDQLNNLRKRHLGDILCDNTSFIKSKMNVFKAGDLDLTCGDHYPLDLETFIPTTGEIGPTIFEMLASLRKARQEEL